MSYGMRGGVAALVAGGLLSAGLAGCQANTPAQRFEQTVTNLREARYRGALTEEEYLQAKRVALTRYAREEGVQAAGPRQGATETTSADVRAPSDH